jgi:hypothetical protein
LLQLGASRLHPANLSAGHSRMVAMVHHATLRTHIRAHSVQFCPQNQKKGEIREGENQKRGKSNTAGPKSYSPLHPRRSNTSCQDSAHSTRSILTPSCEDCNGRASEARTPWGSPDTPHTTPLLRPAAAWNPGAEEPEDQLILPSPPATRSAAPQ